MTTVRTKVRSGILGALQRLPRPRNEAAVRALAPVKRLLIAADPASVMKRRITRAFASGSPARVHQVLDEVNHLRAHAIMLATPESDRGKVRLGDKRGSKSMQYMIDLLPHIQEFIAAQPRGTSFTVLDVGPGTGHGTALLADLYRGIALGYGMKVSALDIRDFYVTYFAAHFPDLPLVIEDVFDHQTKYDIIVTSHAIEHIPDPLGFCRRLQEMARLAVFVSAPFNEPADKLAAGHINIIDDAFIEQLQADEFAIQTSVSWGAFMDPPYDSIIARLPGRATS